MIKQGDFVKIVTPTYSFNTVGDIMIVTEVLASNINVCTPDGNVFWPYSKSSVEVMEGYNKDSRITKACPFCGSTFVRVMSEYDIEQKDDSDEHALTVVCDMTVGGCGASSGYRSNTQYAIEAWEVRYDG